ncbi:MAG: hypothetical protein FH761_10460 [Firmicutes bacterium]|nr:hypothetical protein [Bacillota bacterium]
MIKLSTEDIIIKKPNELLKDEVIKKFGSITEFANFLGKSREIISRYLNSTKLGSNQFKIRIINIFGKGIDELARSEEEQIKNYTDLLFDDIYLYDQDSDINMIAKLKNICEEKNYKNELAKILRIEAMYYFYRNEMLKAEKKIMNAIDCASKYNLKNYEIHFKCDLAMMYFSKRDYLTTEKLLNEINLNFINNDFEKTSKHKYYYSLGTLKNRTCFYDEAIELFNKSIECAPNNRYKGVSLASIGISLKNKCKYEAALNYYFRALRIQPNRDKQVSVLNNIAEAYKTIKNYDIAMEYIMKAISLVEKGNVKFIFTVYITYLEILVLRGDSDNALKQLLEWTYNNESKHITKGNIIRALEIIVDLAIKNNQYDVLEMADQVAFDLSKDNTFEFYIKGLNGIMGDIVRFFRIKNIERMEVKIEKIY